ncbi:MAG: D-glycero-beta-D-manno-heptose-7-phosphate kinase, partial [Rhodospirillaceae bacterium]
MGKPIMGEDAPASPGPLATLTEIVAGFGARRVMCVGDVMLDRFRYGDVKRISPEAPVPIIRVMRENSALGGAGNVARNVAALGASTIFVSAVGDDRAGAEISRLLGKVENVESYLRVAPGRQSTIKTRYVSQDGHQLLRADRETVTALTDDDWKDIKNAISSNIDSVDAVVLSDYAKGVLTGALAPFAIAAARKVGKPVLIDPKGTGYERYKGATLITPNRTELETATAMPADSEDAIVAAAKQLRETQNVDAVLVTRAGDGMTLVSGDAVTHLPAAAREVADVTGAGDTVAAALAVALGGGARFLDAAYLANVAAGVVVGRHGTAVASGHDLTGALLHSGLAQAGQKVVDR